MSIGVNMAATLPNTMLGLALGGAGYVGGKIGYAIGLTKNAPWASLEHFAVQFHNNPLMPGGAITLGNTINYASNTLEEANGAYGDLSVNNGRHEEAHIFQYMELGSLFLPAYLVSGPIANPIKNPFERQAQHWGRSPRSGGYWPW